jgi:hypothetical protein
MMKQADEKAPLLPSPAELDPLNEEERRWLGEFYDWNKSKQWFRGALIVKNHQKQFKTTLEVYTNYNPVLEMKTILEFVNKYQLGVEIIDLSHGDR